MPFQRRSSIISILSLSLYFVYYNFCRIHKTLRVSPAMEAGLTDRLWDLFDIVDLIEAERPKPKKRGPYNRGCPKSERIWVEA